MDVKPYIVGIAGGSGSGKTSFLHDLKNLLPSGSIAVVSQDNYYFPIEKQTRDNMGVVNFDLPSSIDRDTFYSDLKKIAGGETLVITEYTFNNKAKTPKTFTIEPHPIIVLEGLFIFHYTEIHNMLDLRVFIDVDEQTMLSRRIERDSTERGYPENEVRYQWENHVMPAYRKYLEPYRNDAHIIITNHHRYDKGLEVLADHLRAQLKKMNQSSNNHITKELL